MKKKKESEIQLEIAKWLDTQKFFFWRFRYMSRFPIKFLPRGLPDIMILYHGRFIGLEVKVPDYWKRTDNQMQMHENITMNGGSYAVVTSISDTIDFLSRTIGYTEVVV